LDPSLPFKKNIKHIVYVMMENRSFDNLLGWLYDGEQNPDCVTNIPAGPKVKFHGLTDALLEEFAQPLESGAISVEKKKYPIVRGVHHNFLPNATPVLDPNESFKYITEQLYSQCEASGTPKMLGFLQDYYDAHSLFDNLGVYKQILQTYDFDQAPIINTLAHSYGVSDEWFCSIPSQTSINRAFSISGNSVGFMTKEDAAAVFKTAMVNNNQWGGPFNADPAPFTETTIWNVLSENGFATDKDWKIYYSDAYLKGHLDHKTSYTYLMFGKLQKLLNPDGDESVDDPRYKTIAGFYEDAKNGTLPRFSYLEPLYTWEFLFSGIGIHGTDYHPPADIRGGEGFLRDIYDSLNASPQWSETLLVVAFDEHGGTFDHVPPPTTAIDPGGADANQSDFDFKRYGVRVPMLFISPWVKEHTVIRSGSKDHPFDHTSWLATLLDWFDLAPDLLGKRTAAAPTFEMVIQDKARGDIALPALADIKSDPPIPEGSLPAEAFDLISRLIHALDPKASDRAEILKTLMNDFGSHHLLYREAHDRMSRWLDDVAKPDKPV